MNIQEMEDLKHYFDEMKRLINSEYRDETKIDELKGNFNSMSIKINKKEKLKQLEQVANLRTYPSKCFNSFCYDDDDDDEDYNFAITPNKPVYSLTMGDEHPDTVLATKSDEFIKSKFTTFLNVLFDVDYEFDSSDDQSFSDEDAQEKKISNPLFEEEIIPMKIDQHHYNAESDHIESLSTYDSSLIISSKIYSLSMSSPVNDSLIEEIDLSFTLDYPMSSGIEDDDYDSERDILTFKDLPSNDTLSLLVIELFHFDIPSFFRPLAKQPDGNTGILNVKMMGDFSEQKVLMPKLMITLVPNQDESPDFLSHLVLQTFKPFAKCPMMIYEKNTPILDVFLFHFNPP
nr:hypothetical protein [Tanacetum cinerariifolium]